MDVPPAVRHLAGSLRTLGWVSDLLVAGSLATGDHRPGVSDLDLVALVTLPVDGARRAALAALHRDLDAGTAAGAKLGCVYVHLPTAAHPDTRHPTWTHGVFVDRILSGVTRVELAGQGFAVFGRGPREVFGPVSADDVRRAARAELTGYWTKAARRPWWWLDPDLADLGLTSMARGRHAAATGTLLTKTAAIELARVPDRLRADLRARRAGTPVRSPRLRTAWIAWRDARRTTAAARRSRSPGEP